MKLWSRDYSLEELNRLNAGNLLGHLGIEFVAIDSDSLTARMPVDHRTTQPFGLLHGGASVALAESVGSFAAFLTLREHNKTTVGIEVNAITCARSLLASFMASLVPSISAATPRSGIFVSAMSAHVWSALPGTPSP